MLAPLPRRSPPKPERRCCVRDRSRSRPDDRAKPPPSEDGIFSDNTRKAMDDAFAKIDPAPEPPPAPAPAAARCASPDGSSRRNGVRARRARGFEPVLQKYLVPNKRRSCERMKPLIREWMDEHFPALLEGAVRAEVERVVKARGQR